MATGHIRERNGNLLIVLDLGRDPLTGKRNRHHETIKGNNTTAQKKAEKRLRKLLNDAETGKLAVDPERLRFGEFLERWIKHLATTGLRIRTRERYAELLRTRVIPALGNVRLQQLQPIHLQDFYSSLLEDGARRDGKAGGLSLQTVLHHHRAIHRALETAVKWNLIYRNPAASVEPPVPEAREMLTLDAEEAGRLLDAIQTTRYPELFVLAIMTGMRQGELHGLRWRDIDWENSVISVQQVMVNSKEKGLILEPTAKTKAGRRPIILSPEAMTALKRQRVRQAKERLRAGEKWKDQGLVFPAVDGGILHPSGPYHALKRALSRASLEDRFRFHDQRHTHASLLMQLGIHPKVVSERLGHSKVSITLDTYSHVVPSLQEAAAVSLEEHLFGRQSPTLSPLSPKMSPDSANRSGQERTAEGGKRPS